MVALFKCKELCNWSSSLSLEVSSTIENTPPKKMRCSEERANIQMLWIDKIIYLVFT